MPNRQEHRHLKYTDDQVARLLAFAELNLRTTYPLDFSTGEVGCQWCGHVPDDATAEKVDSGDLPECPNPDCVGVLARKAVREIQADS